MDPSFTANPKLRPAQPRNVAIAANGRPQRAGWPGWVLPAGALLALTFTLAAQGPVTARVPPPLPPLGRPPVELFRELLAATPEKRDELLRPKPPAARELIQRRLREHEALSPEARAEAESQLRLAQFRYYLSPLLRVPASERGSKLDLAPAEDRALLEERLRVWDTLPPDARARLLESSETLHHFVQRSGAEPSRLTNALATAAPGARADIERQFAQWSALSETERAQRAAAFQDFFGLTETQRAKAIHRLPDAERVLIEKTLERFARLPEAERLRCIAGFDKLSSLPAAERDEFLRGASRWQAMTPEERALWRRIVLRPSPPPLPPVPTPGIVSTNR
jgi:hypothetical protein